MPQINITSVKRNVKKPTDYAMGKVREWWYWNKFAIGILLATLAVWQLYSMFLSRGDFFFPSPNYVLIQTIENADVVIPGLMTTSTAIVGGFGVAVLLGVPLGILFGEVFLIRQAALPTIVYIYSLPQAIVAPLFILWFGTNIYGVIAFVSIFSLFPILVNAITGFTQLDREYSMLAEQIGASRWQRIKKIQFWAAVPNIVAGIKIAVQASVVSTIIIEFIATSNGLGYLLQVAGGTAREGMMFGIIFLIGIVALLLYKFVEAVIDAILRWRHLA